MDILSPVLFFYIYHLSENVPIIHDFLTIIIAFGILAIFWLILLLFFTIATAFAALLWLPQIFKNVYNLGIYHPLVEKNITNKTSPRFGEYDSEKLWKVLKANLVVGFSLFLVLMYIFNSFPTSFFNENLVTNQTTNQSRSSMDENPSNVKLSNGAFALTLLFVPTFLMSLRLFANPTQHWIKIIIMTENRSTDEIIRKIRYFKDQVISYYYSFIVGTVILFYFLISLVLYVNGGKVNFDLITPFIPKMDLFSIIFFVVLEIVAMIIITVLGEWYLKISPPVCQD